MKKRILKTLIVSALLALMSFGLYNSAKAWNGISTLKNTVTP